MIHSAFRRFGVLACAAPVALLVAALAGCSSIPSDGGETESVANLDGAHVAGGIVRVSLDGKSYDLGIVQDSPRTDAGDPPPCLNKVGTIQFGLNWAASDLHRRVPAVRVSLLTVDGLPLTLGYPNAGCRAARNVTFKALQINTQLVLAAALPDREVGLRQLWVIVNDKRVLLPLIPTCKYATPGDPTPTNPEPCSDDPLTFDASKPYSKQLTVR